MLARLRKRTEENEGGFTLIELLVVIIIIGILAAIAIPVFLNQRKKGVDASIKSDLRQAANEVEGYFTDGQVYPTNAQISQASPVITVKESPNSAIEYALSTDTTQTGAVAGDGYCLRGSSPKGTATGGATGKYYYYDSKAGGLNGTATATAPTTGACKGIAANGFASF